MSDTLNAPQMPAERSNETVGDNCAVYGKNGLMELPEGKFGGWKSGSKEYTTLREGVADNIRLLRDLNDRVYNSSSSAIEHTAIVRRTTDHADCRVVIKCEHSTGEEPKFIKTLVREFDPKRGYAVHSMVTEYRVGRKISRAHMKSGLGVVINSSLRTVPEAFAHMGFKTAEAFFRLHSPEIVSDCYKDNVARTTECRLSTNPHIIALIAKHKIPWFSNYDVPEVQQGYGKDGEQYMAYSIHIPSFYIIDANDPLAARLAKFYAEAALYTTVPELRESDVDRLATTSLVRPLNAREAVRNIGDKHPFHINTRVRDKTGGEPSVENADAIRFLVEHNLPFEVATGTVFLAKSIHPTPEKPVKPALMLNLLTEEDYTLFLAACPHD